MLAIQKRVSGESEFIKNTSSVLIIKKVLCISFQEASKVFFKSKIKLISTVILNKIYLFLYIRHLFKISTISGNNNLIDKEKAIIYLTFHFSCNFEVIIPYLSTLHGECYVIYSDNFFSKNSQFRLFKNPEQIINSRYLNYHNKNFNLKLLNFNEPQILYKINNLLKAGKKILLLFDEFPKETLKKDSKYIVNYKINNIIAAKVPISLFYILKKSNAQIVPIVNIRKGYIKNNLIISDNISYDYKNNNFQLENERVLKEIYDFYIKCIKLNPCSLSSFVWLRFYHYVKNDAQLKNALKDKKISVQEKYNPNGKFIVYNKKKSNAYLLFRTDDLKCARVDYLTVLLLKEIKYNNLIFSNFVETNGKKDIENRIKYLLQENFIV